jgi:NAD(P)-dependent dehydrogenase (short-subunit alcohol dehydrogenase family)
MQAPDPAVPLRLDGRVILVTGGAGDIGSAVAAMTAQLGATVIIADNGTGVTGAGQDAGLADRVARRLGARHGEVSGQFCDLTDGDQVESMMTELFDKHGNVDAVIATAGTLRTMPVWETSLEDWRSVIDSHATHTFLVSAAACRRWRASCADRAGAPCSLVIHGAATGLVGRPDLGVTHAAAKGAVASMTLELAHEMAPYGVTVNSVCAANVRGRMAAYLGAGVSAEGDAADVSSPRHSAALSAYLATGDTWITGQVFRVLGGLIGRYTPWQLTASLEKQDSWTIEDIRLGVRRLCGAYPEYKALQGRHRAF